MSRHFPTFLILTSLLFLLLIVQPVKTQALTPTPTSIPSTNQEYVRGLNLFGGWQGEFGGTNAFATPAMMEYFKTKGFTHFRAGFSWKFLQPTLNGPLDPTYLAQMDALMASARSRGLKIAFVPLPGLYKGNNVATSAVPQAAFNDMWKKLAAHYKDDAALWGYDLINEPNMGDTWNTTIAPSAIAAIRTVDMTHPILVPTSTGGYGHYFKYHLAGLPMSDPANNLIYEAHFYFDTPPNGQYPNGFDVPNANLNIGVDNAKDFVNWCVSNNVKCFAGEYGVPAGWKMGTQTCLYDGGMNKDPRWLTVLDNFLTYLDQNKISGAYWSGGPYGDISSIGPFCDAQSKFYDAPQMAILTKHLGSSVSVSPAPTPVTSCNEDINSDHVVDLTDYSLLITDFLKSVPINPRADINRDGLVDLTDYSLLVRKFLKSC
ncbi:MAG: cellulase family glycosylhydrolase [Patescibacteria group bacterium]